MQMYLY